MKNRGSSIARSDANQCGVSRGFVGEEPNLDVGRLPLPAGQAGRFRDRRRGHPLLDRLGLTNELVGCGRMLGCGGVSRGHDR